MYRLTETQAPAAEPLDFSEVKAFLRVDHNSDDVLIAGLISAARHFCENLTGRSLINRNYSLYLDCWPSAPAPEWWDGVREGADIARNNGSIHLPKSPLVSVTRVNVYDAAGAATEFASANYFVDTVGNPGRLVLKDGVMPPTPGRPANGIEIQFIAGYGPTSASIPAPLKHGMKQVIAHLYQYRGDTPEQALVASGATVLFRPYKAMSVV